MIYKTTKDYVVEQMIKPFKEAMESNDEKRIYDVFYYVIWKYVEQTDWVKAYEDLKKKKLNPMEYIMKFEAHNYKSFMDFKDVLPSKIDEEE